MNNITPELEVWKPVVGFESWYEISNLGRVKRLRTFSNINAPKMLKICLNNHGYEQVMLNKEGHKKLCLVHRLISVAFLGQPPTAKHQINHKNGVKYDNRLENLEWCTASENIRHAYRTGLIKKGCVSLETKREVLLLLKQTPRLDMVEIAQRCGVGIYIVEAVAGKRHREDIWYNGFKKVDIYEHLSRWARIQPNDVEAIKQLLSEGKLYQYEIADKFGVDPAVITRIKKGTYYGRTVIKSK